MSFSLDEMPDTPAEVPASVRLMRETIQIIEKFLPNGLAMTGTDSGINIINDPAAKMTAFMVLS